MKIQRRELSRDEEAKVIEVLVLLDDVLAERELSREGESRVCG